MAHVTLTSHRQGAELGDYCLTFPPGSPWMELSEWVEVFWIGERPDWVAYPQGNKKWWNCSKEALSKVTLYKFSIISFFLHNML